MIYKNELDSIDKMIRLGVLTNTKIHVELKNEVNEKLNKYRRQPKYWQHTDELKEFLALDFCKYLERISFITSHDKSIYIDSFHILIERWGLPKDVIRLQYVYEDLTGILFKHNGYHFDFTKEEYRQFLTYEYLKYQEGTLE